MHTFYTDKTEDFKCKIGVEGSDIDDVQARLVFENTGASLLFEGKVDSSGECTVPVTKLKGFLKEGTSGNLKLEVIANDTFFSPWIGEFLIKTSKKVTVEVAENSKPSIREQKLVVKVETPKTPKKTHSDVVLELFKMKGITKANLRENIDIATPLLGGYVEKYKVKQPVDSLLNEVLKKLK